MQNLLPEWTPESRRKYRIYYESEDSELSGRLQDLPSGQKTGIFTIKESKEGGGVKITNLKNFPEALVKAFQNDPYDKGDSDFTATGLIKPARISALEARHRHEIEEDVEDGLYRLYGQVAHGILERANMADLAEKRFFSTWTVGDKDYKVSAQLDTLSIQDGTLTDYKFTTSYGFKNNQPPKPEWVAQLNIQLELLRRNGLDASKLQIVGLLRDWQIRDAKANPDHPQAPVAVQDIPIWSREQTNAFIAMRIAAHVDAAKSLPECTPDDRWAKPDTWAVIKRGQKRAINGGVQFSQETAESVCAKNPGTLVQYRQGESTRCMSYCKVNKFCSQFQRLTADVQTDADKTEEIA